MSRSENCSNIRIGSFIALARSGDYTVSGPRLEIIAPRGTGIGLISPPLRRLRVQSSPTFDQA
jgi:hypothetical protein